MNNRKLAVITGASSGIGAEFARQLANQGYDLLLVARRKPLLESLKGELETAFKINVDYRSVDFSNSTELRQFCFELSKVPVDLLVNNAGFGSFGHFDSLPIESECQMLEVNVIAGLRILHAVLPNMKQRRKGGILVTSSVLGFQPTPYMATYAGTKAFNLYHSLALRQELEPYGIRVVSVCPGPTDTEFAGVARVPGQFTAVRRDSVSLVVRQSLRAYERNNACIVPGLRSWALSLLSRTLPFASTIPLFERILRGSLKSR
jgi:short-subunit dehydrogenase